MKLKKTIAGASMLIASAFAGLAGAADVRGVSEDTIVLGTIQDLSGPLAALSQEALNGMFMHIDEINADGGINGRELELVVADHGYQPQRALLASRRMIQRDEIFAMIGEMGSPTTMASIPILIENNAPSLFPFSGATGMYLPRHRLKWSFAVPYAAQIRAGIKHMIDEHGYERVCAIYQNDEFGTEVLRGVKEGMADLGRELAASTSFKRGETNFTAGVSKLRSADCDIVVIGAALREPVAIMRAAQKLGWEPDFLGSSASYTIKLPRLAGDVANGFYATSQVEIPYVEDASSAELQEWAQAYEAEFGEKPDVFSAYGYQIIGAFAKAARQAGEDLTVDSLVAALQELTIEEDMFGASFEFTETQHMGGTTVRLFQIVDGKWQPVTDTLDVKAKSGGAGPGEGQG